jgi:hypothetical protein
MNFSMDNDGFAKNKVTIEIDNLTEAQSIAIEELMSVWQYISDKKFFYWTAFLIDGFVDWQCKIKVNGKSPERYMGEIGLRSGKVLFEQADGRHLPEEMYFLDYYKIQKNLDEKQKEKENNESVEN